MRAPFFSRTKHTWVRHTIHGPASDERPIMIAIKRCGVCVSDSVDSSELSATLEG